MFTASLSLSLSQIVSTSLDSLTYIESITDAANDIGQTEKNKLLKVKTITTTNSSQLLHPFVL